MTTPPTASRLERFFPWLAGAIIALPVLIAHYPPMADLPLHEAVVGLLRHWGDPTFVPPDVYELNIGQANQLFYFLILPLSYPLGVTLATKVVVAAAMLLLPVSLAHTADYLGVTRWTAVLLTPLGIGWMFFWGLLANMIGLAVYFFALPSFDRFCTQPTRRGFWVVFGWVVLLHFAHLSVAMFAAGTLMVLTACSWRGWRENALRLLPAVLQVCFAVTSLTLGRRIANAYGASLPSFSWDSVWHKAATIPATIYGNYEWQVRDMTFAVCSVPALMFALERWKNRSRTRRTLREWAFHFRFEILGVALLVGYFAAPLNMRATTLVYHRFLAPAWALLVLTAATRVKLASPWRLPRLLAAFIPLVPLLTAWPQFAESDSVYRQLDQAIDHMDRGSTYLVMELGPDRHILYSPLTGMGHIVARLGGRGIFDSTDSVASPVHLRADRAWVHLYERLDMHAYHLMPPFDLTRFRYVILHTTDWTVDAVVTAALQPEARFVFHSGEWTVMESTLPLIPPNVPDSLVPLPHPLTLRKRAVAAAQQMGLPVEILPNSVR